MNPSHLRSLAPSGCSMLQPDRRRKQMLHSERSVSAFRGRATSADLVGKNVTAANLPVILASLSTGCAAIMNSPRKEVWQLARKWTEHYSRLFHTAIVPTEVHMSLTMLRYPAKLHPHAGADPSMAVAIISRERREVGSDAAKCKRLRSSDDLRQRCGVCGHTAQCVAKRHRVQAN